MIIVCPLSAVQQQVKIHAPSGVVGILSPDMDHPVLDGFAPDRHLRLSFNDVTTEVPGLTAPHSEDMDRLMRFIRDWDRASPLLIHCWAGISRSTAAAYIASCMLRPRENEQDLAQALRKASPSATPNQRLVALADDALGRNGRMRRAIAAIGRGADAFEGTPFSLDL